jgi:DNA-binding NarL/FixJ family response regulator
MILKPADSMPVTLRSATDGRPSHRRGGPRCRRVLLAIGPDGRDTWRSALLAAGHLVVAVEDPEAALDTLVDAAFDVCLLDLNLPEALESAKLYRFLSLDHRPVPIVGLVDGDGGVEARHGGALCGCLPRDGGPAALAALLPDLFAVDPEQGEPARVISLAARRQMQTPPR